MQKKSINRFSYCNKSNLIILRFVMQSEWNVSFNRWNSKTKKTIETWHADMFTRLYYYSIYRVFTTLFLFANVLLVYSDQSRVDNWQSVANKWIIKECCFCFLLKVFAVKMNRTKIELKNKFYWFSINIDSNLSYLN